MGYFFFYKVVFIIFFILGILFGGFGICKLFLYYFEVIGGEEECGIIFIILEYL